MLQSSAGLGDGARAKRQKRWHPAKRTFIIGDWRADHSAPGFLDGAQVGWVYRYCGWYDVRVRGLLWGGGKSLNGALSAFNLVYQYQEDGIKPIICDAAPEPATAEAVV